MKLAWYFIDRDLILFPIGASLDCFKIYQVIEESLKSPTAR